MLKNAHIDSQITEFTRHLRDDQFALIVHEDRNRHRFFPVMNKEATVQSVTDFNDTFKFLGPKERRTAAYFLQKAAHVYSVPVSDIINKCAAEVDSNNVDFESVEVIEDNEERKIFALPEYKKYPLDKEADVKAASRYFDERVQEMPHEYRCTYAQNLLKRASDLRIEVSEEVMKYANPTYKKDLSVDINNRVLYNTDSKPYYQKLASLRDKTDPVTFAMALKDVDEKFGLDRKWNKGLRDPMDAVFAPYEKKATATGLSWAVNGRNYNEDDLKRACSSEIVKKMYSASQLKQIENPAVFDSLPKVDKETILSYA